MFLKKKNTGSDRIKRVRKNILSEGRAVFEKYKVDKVILFGSLFSIDLGNAAEVAALAIPLTKKEFWTFRQEIGILAGCPVDVFCQDDDPNFLTEALEKGELIYSR